MARERGRARMPVSVIDISTNGCRIEMSCGLLIGSWVWLNIAGLETQYMRVVWCRDGFAGLEFTSPIHESVIDALLAHHDSTNEENVKQLRDLAKRTHIISTQGGAYAEADEIAELSRDCITGAILDGLGMDKSETGIDGKGTGLSGSMIKRPPADNTI
jgi:PilZ domain-containing protein